MASRQVYTGQDDFSFGMARDVAPHRIDKRAIYDLINGLYDDDGSPFKRGGTVGHSLPFVSSPGVNLVTNPSFETNTTGWTALSGTITRVNTWASDGTWSGEVAGSGDVVSNNGAVVAGDVVNVDLDVNVSPDTTAIVRIGFLDAGLNDIGSAAPWFVGPGTHSVSFTETAPANSAWTYLEILTAPTAGSCRIDNVRVRVEEGDGLTALWDGYFDVGQRTLVADFQNFGVLDSDDETVLNLGGDGMPYPKSFALIESMLFIGGGYIYGGSRKTANYVTAGGNTNLTQGSKTVTDASGGFSANVDAGMLLQVAGTDRVYVVASVDSDTQITLRDAYEGATTTTANPTFYPLYAITASDPYPDAEVYAVCANRLVWASGFQVQFSAVPDPTTGKARPHIRATTDYHELPQGANVTGLAPTGLTLLIFSTGGVWTLDGLPFEIVDAEGNPQHRLQFVSGEYVLVNQSGLASFQGAVVAPCLDGVYLLDGAGSPKRLSHPIDELWRHYTDRGYRLGGAVVYRGHYLVPVLNLGGTGIRDLLVCRLDQPNRGEDGQLSYPWSRFNGGGGRLSAFAVRAPLAQDEPLLLGAETDTTSQVVNCSGYFVPTAQNKLDANGSAFTWMLETRDYETGGNTENVVRTLRTRAELIDAAADNPLIRFEYGLNQRRRTDPNSILDVNLLDDLDTDDNDGDFILAGNDEGLFFPLNCNMAESDGVTPHNCPVNKAARLIRFRLYNNEPCEELRLRSLELAIRPSEAVRR